MSKKFLFAVFIFLIFGVSFSNAAEKKVIEGFDSPESIASDGKYVYVSNMGKELKATAKDGDGYVSRLSLAGEVLDKQFLPEKGMLNSPKGIAIVGHVLYVADVDHLIGFDLKTRQQVMDIDFSSEKTLFLNDVAVKDAHTLFVSATDLGKIFQVRLSPVKPHFQALALKEEIRGPNGLLYQPATKSLFVVGFGKDNQPNGQVGVVYMQRGVSYEILSDVQGLLDGVALVSHSQLLFSDWVAFEKKGELKSFNLKTKEIKTLDLGDKIAGPADFYYQPSSRKIWIPEMMAGKILIEDLPQ